MSVLIMIIKAIIMGIVEGITEFLPVSSTGHLIIVGHFINFQPGTGLYSKQYIDMFNIVIQLGAILAIIVLYFDKFKDSFKKENIKPWNSGFRLWVNLFAAFFPIGVVGFFFEKPIKKYLMDDPRLVACTLIIGGILLILFENKFRKSYTITDIDKISVKKSFGIGLFQCLSVIPGMSRSASTIMGGWVNGLSTPAAAEFSFFLSVPTMIIASLDQLYKSFKGGIHTTLVQYLIMAIGFLVSFIVAMAVVEKFINFLKKRPLRIFAVYRIFIGIVLLILAATKVITL